MYITDINGKKIEVKSLTEAISQAKGFAQLLHSDAIFKNLDDYLKSYWNDIVEKLHELEKSYPN